ncbi:MAG TPA: hypothetical protein PKY35_09375 [Candidatus Hydrogenedentes bacterium]|nr:hypothetical protein [Candidatus Hydrogenedentota bacterium]HOL77228.1 hypothetical protein [Candidatus Hydrogenedentota bacterium]HPO86517.1 hypothetical protein [Candidatus Hydrogenedentota bacterium]
MNWQLTVVLVVLLFVAGLIAWAIVAGSSGGTYISGGKFRARPGTMREAVQPIVSSRQESSLTSEKQEDSQGVSSVSVESEKSQYVEHLLNAQTPEEGIRQAEEYLESPRSSDEKSLVLGVEALLYLQKVPEDLVQAETAAREAYELAQTPEIKYRATVVLAQVIERKGDIPDACKTISEVLLSHLDPSPSRIVLQVNHGLLLESIGETTAAQSAYNDALRDAEQSLATVDEDVLKQCRLAGFRLAQIYRAQGKNREADEVVRRVHAINQNILDRTSSF